MCDSFHCATERGYRALYPPDRDSNYRSLLITPRSCTTPGRGPGLIGEEGGDTLAEIGNPKIGDLAVQLVRRGTGNPLIRIPCGPIVTVHSRELRDLIVRRR